MYVAQKPCNFAGKHFAIGEEIPEELIDPNRAGTLEKFGRIKRVETDTSAKGENKPIEPVKDEGGENPQPKDKTANEAVKTPLNDTQKPEEKPETKPETKPAAKNGKKPEAKTTKQKGGK